MALIYKTALFVAYIIYSDLAGLLAKSDASLEHYAVDGSMISAVIKCIQEAMNESSPMESVLVRTSGQQFADPRYQGFDRHGRVWRYVQLTVEGPILGSTDKAGSPSAATGRQPGLRVLARNLLKVRHRP